MLNSSALCGFHESGSLGNSRKANVLLVHQQLLICEALKRLLECEPDFELVAISGNTTQAHEILQRQAIDVVILNVNPNNASELGSLWRVRDGVFKGPIVILADHLKPRDVFEVLAAGATGIVLKQSSPNFLSRCIREVLNGGVSIDGGVWINQANMRDFIEHSSSEPGKVPQRLTGRERDVLAAVLNGLSTKVIAYQLDISESAVKSAVQQLFRKTGVKTRSQLVRLGMERYRAQLELSTHFSNSASV